MLYEIVEEICEAKRGKVYPVLATELELKLELASRGVAYTAESFGKMCSELATDLRITTIRTLNYTAYAASLFSTAGSDRMEYSPVVVCPAPRASADRSSCCSWVLSA